jgi:hypothetical protein
MTFGAEIWGPPLIAAGASYLSGKGGANKESKMQRTKRKLIDELLSSVGGQGRFADLFGSDENAFQKSFVEPAKARFQNQIAPQIQQSFIASGQQRGTGVNDTLTRAGVDMDSMLNEKYYDFQQSGLNRKQNIINSILGGGDGMAANPSDSQNIMSGVSGALSSDEFGKSFANLFKDDKSNTTAGATPPRKGFATD